jgi:ATP-dependent DNA helicase RecG
VDSPKPRSLRDLSLREVSVLKTVSERKAAQLSEWGVGSVLDLLTTYPRRYIDRTVQADVSGLEVGAEAAVLAEVRRVRTRPARNRRTVVTLTVRDETGAMEVVFFNQPWRAKQLREGTEAIFWGKAGEYRGTRQMVNPVVDVVAGVDDPVVGQARRTLRILPVYPASAKAGLTSWEIGTFVEEGLERAGVLVDPLPEAWRAELALEDRTTAFGAIHRPDSLNVVPPARRRLVFDELFRLQLALVLRRRAFEHNARALRHDVSPLEITGGKSGTLVARFLAGLPFELTTAQRRALAVIVADLAGPFPMHRLLQGDVGSGKTVVAVTTLLGAVQSGHQGALMVPTEVLAEQHATAVRALLGGLDVRVELLTSRVKGKARAALLADLASGAVAIVVGTHALLTEEVAFASLGVVVIDEQHRFGVEQRATLRAKGEEGDPDLLVMTATPIPRTAAMVIFGDLDLTTLDEMPPGRVAITTTWLPEVGDEHLAWDRVRAEVAAGHRAFVVCPLVGESLRVEAKSATEEFERLSGPGGELAGLRVGLLHGQMAPAAREEAMAHFRAGEVEVLVATTVIEVGVDVPEATVMVIESADRFGMAQLHQLRGRVGRGAWASWCFLLGGGGSGGSGGGGAGSGTDTVAAERLAAVARTTDGFALAEDDLRLRGEGTLLGSRQKGHTDLRLASLSDPEDRFLLTEARRVAEAIVGDDPLLAAHAELADEILLFLDEDEGEYLFKS